MQGANRSRRGVLAAVFALPVVARLESTTVAGRRRLSTLGFRRSSGVTNQGNGNVRMRATTASGGASSYLRFRLPNQKLKIGHINNLQATFNSTAAAIPCTPTTPRFVIATTAGSVVGMLSPTTEPNCSTTRTVELVRPGGTTKNFDVSAFTGSSVPVTYDQMKQIVSPYKVKGITLVVTVPDGGVGEFSWIVKPKVVVKVRR